MHFEIGFIAMPFQIATHPEDSPTVLGSHVGRLGYRCFPQRRIVLPVWPDLKYFDTLPSNSAADVELRPDVWRRPAALHELRKIALEALSSRMEKAMRKPEIVLGIEGYTRCGFRDLTSEVSGARSASTGPTS